MKYYFVLLILSVASHAFAQVDDYQMRNLNYRLHAESTHDQLRYIYYKAKVVDTIKHMREYNNRMHRVHQGQINNYSDLDLISNSVTSALYTIESDAFGYDNNTLIKGIISLLPVPKASLLTRFVNFDSPGADPGKVLEWLRANNFENELNNSNIDSEFSKIFNNCTNCGNRINSHFQKRFDFKVTEDHLKYSSAVRQARDIEKTQEEVGEVKSKLQDEMQKVKGILQKVAKNQESTFKLVEEVKTFIENSDKLSGKEKLDYKKKLNQGKVSQVLNLLAEKNIAIEKAKMEKLKQLQIEYDQNMMAIKEARVYSSILTTVIGFKDPQTARKAQGLITVALNLAEMTMKFNNPKQSGIQISAALLTGNYIMAGLQLFTMFSTQGESQDVTFYKNIMKALADISKQIQNLGEQINYRFDAVDERLRFIQTEMVLLFKRTHENQNIIITQNSQIIEKLNHLYDFSENHFKKIEDSFKNLLTKEFLDCKYDVDYGMISSWSKQRNQDCIREFFQYSVHLSQEEIFNDEDYFFKRNNNVSTINSVKLNSLDHINYIISYMKEHLGFKSSVEKVPNPIMFNMGISYFSEGYRYLVEKFGDSLTYSEKEGYKRIYATHKGIIESYEKLQKDIIKDKYQVLNVALNDMFKKNQDFKLALKRFEKEFVKAKVGNNSQYNFSSEKVKNVDIDFDTDSQTINKCDSIYTTKYSNIDYSNLDSFPNISIPVDLNWPFVKRIPEQVKIASKLGLGKIKFCYEFESIGLMSLEDINNIYQKNHAGRRYSRSTRNSIHQDLMSGNLVIRINTILVPNASRIKELRKRIFKDPEFKANVLSKLKGLQRIYTDKNLTALDVIKAPMNVGVYSRVLNYRPGIAKLQNHERFYLDCANSLNKCDFSNNGKTLKITYNFNANASNDQGVVKSTKVIHAKYIVSFSPKKDFLTADEKNRMLNSDSRYLIQSKRDRNVSFHNFTPVILHSPLNVIVELSKKKKLLKSEYLELLSGCISKTKSTCVTDNTLGLVKSAENLQTKINVLESSNFIVRSLFNMSFYNSFLANKELYNLFNHQLNYVSPAYLVDFLIPMYPNMIFDYSLSKYEGEDHFDVIVSDKKKILERLKVVEHKKIFDFSLNLMEVK